MALTELDIENSEAAYRKIVLKGKLRLDVRDDLSPLEEELTNSVCDLLDSLPDTIIDGGTLLRNRVNGNYFYSVSVYAPYRQQSETKDLISMGLKRLKLFDDQHRGISLALMDLGEVGNEVMVKLEFVMPAETRYNSIIDFLQREISDLEGRLFVCHPESDGLYR